MLLKVAIPPPLDPMDTPCSSETISEISKWSFNWKEVGMNVLSSKSVQNIERESLNALTEEEKREKILHMWLEQNQEKATYSALVELFELTQNAATAEALKKLLASKDVDGSKSFWKYNKLAVQLMHGIVLFNYIENDHTFSLACSIFVAKS